MIKYVYQVEMVSREGMVVPVSLWLRSLPTEDRCLAVAEPVERRVAQVQFPVPLFLYSLL